MQATNDYLKIQTFSPASIAKMNEIDHTMLKELGHGKLKLFKLDKTCVDKNF